MNEDIRSTQLARDRVVPGEAKIDDLGFELPGPARLTRSRAVLLACAGALVLAGAFLAAFLPKRHAHARLEAEVAAQNSEILQVSIVKPKLGSSQRAVTLPGSVQALEETTIYPRASGYVRNWHSDIGDRVKAGALLAEIDTPELDQQLLQARAELAQAEASLLQAKANDQFSKQNLVRYEQLTPAGVASQQELEKQRAQAVVDEANVKVAQANVAAQRANIERLVQLKSFTRVTAPFDGTITARTVERGSLVSAGTASALFKLAAIDPVRVFVQIPQDIAPGVRSGFAAKVSVREYPGRVFEGQIARAAGALDPQTRTMTTEVRVPNPNSELFTGMYAEVTLSLPSPHRVCEVPATALLNDASGLRIATVTASDVLRLVPVTIERDTGSTLEISSGLRCDERIVKQAGAETVDGRKVRVLASSRL